MANLALSIVTDRNPNFLKHYYGDVYLCLKEFKDALPIDELMAIFPPTSGIMAEFERSRIVLQCSERLKCELDGEPMQPNKPYVLLPTADRTLKIGNVEFNISPFISS
jgi:hypothetical protein